MKKKANSILALFIFSFSMLVLSVFGTDACFIVLSRYKLQKITESIAADFISRAMTHQYQILGSESTTERNSRVLKAYNDISDRYKGIYNADASGVVLFNIDEISYRENITKEDAIVKVKTTSRVLPVFLKFIGIQAISINSNAYAMSKSIPIKGTINKAETEGAFDFDNIKDSIAYNLEFPKKVTLDNEDFFIDSINAKGKNTDDFSVNFTYNAVSTDGETTEPDADIILASDNKFFIFGGYKDKTDKIRWEDLGNRTTNAGDDNIQKICLGSEETPPSEGGESTEDIKPDDTNISDSETTDSNFNYCFYNIDQGGLRNVHFSLSKDLGADKNEAGNIKKITHLRIYKAGNKDGYKTYNDSQANVVINIYGNISLANKRKYDNFNFDFERQFRRQ